MRQTEFKSKTEERFDAFFEYESPHDYAPLQNPVNDPRPLIPEKADSARAPSPAMNFLRQLCLFFPGAFFLYYISMGTAIVVGEFIVGKHEFRFHRNMIYVYLIGLVAFFMTWVGLGDLKNKKHLAIPASIISAGALIGAIVAATENLIWLSRKIAMDFEYAILLFPLGLIVPFLAKGLVDREKPREI